MGKRVGGKRQVGLFVGRYDLILPAAKRRAWPQANLKGAKSCGLHGQKALLEP